jgi:hypothetical protein
MNGAFYEQLTEAQLQDRLVEVLTFGNRHQKARLLTALSAANLTKEDLIEGSYHPWTRATLVTLAKLVNY